MKEIMDRHYFIAESAVIVGDVSISEEASVWHNCTLRGDLAKISIGRGSNIQDNCVIHVSPDEPTTVGEYVSVGHGAILHSCTVGNDSLIGMGSIILNGARIGAHCMIGAGTLITQNKEIPPGSLVYGNPGRIVRTLSDAEIMKIEIQAKRYIKQAESQLSKVDI